MLNRELVFYGKEIKYFDLKEDFIIVYLFRSYLIFIIKNILCENIYKKVNLKC